IISFKQAGSRFKGNNYDSLQTSALKLPASVDGYAFVNSQGKYRYILWAVTTKDNSEAAQSGYSFPAGFEANTLTAFNWNYSVKNSEKSTIDGKKINLTGTPVIVELSMVAVTDTSKPKVIANAGSAVTITLPASSATLDGTASTANNSIKSYAWSQLTGKAVQLNGNDSALTQVSGFTEAGTYSFALAITDSKGNKDIDTVLVTVLLQEANEKVKTVQAKFGVYPNPALNKTTTLNLVSPETGSGRLVLYNNHGVVVWTKQFEKSTELFNQVLNFPGIPAGLYYLSVYVENNKLSTLKIIL
ncbi:MAG: T9SS type A sorting domain-containing protein, partial [Flavihumibacter sp.]